MTGREITSVKDLWDPAFKGKVGMMADDTELGSVGMLALGIDPTNSTPADWKRAADLLRKQRDEGIVRQYYDQSYIKALEQGDTWISMAWSGDVFQAKLSGYQEPQVRDPERGRDALARQLHDPAARRAPGRRDGVDRLLLPAEGRGDDRGLGQLPLPGPRRAADDRGRARRPDRRRQPARLPDAGDGDAASSPTTTPRASRTRTSGPRSSTRSSSHERASVARLGARLPTCSACPAAPGSASSSSCRWWRSSASR